MLMRTPREDGSADVGGVFRDAIVSRIGRRIVFDVEKARELADDFVREVDGIELSDNSFFEHSDKNTAEMSSNVDKESGLFLVE